MSEVELKTCPLCGGKTSIKYAIQRWNRRVDDER